MLSKRIPKMARLEGRHTSQQCHIFRHALSKMSPTRKKRKVYDLNADDATSLLRTISELQEQLDEEDDNLPHRRTSVAAQEF